MRSNSVLKYAKKLVQAKQVYIFLIVFLLLFFTLNGFIVQVRVSKETSVNEIDSNGESNNLNELEKLKERIKILDENLKESRKGVRKLHALVENAYKDAEKSAAVLTQIRRNDYYSKNAVLVISCNRAKAVENHLKQLIDYRQNSRFKFPIIVSQDCGHNETAGVIKSFSSHLFASLQHPNQSEIRVNSQGNDIPLHMQGYYKISRHYKWALDQVFMNKANSFEFAIVTEDDLNISRDFFEYFYTMSRALSVDPSLYCVSAWNDNGKNSTIDISRPELVHRTDFFPGLGWMLQRSLWLELREKWPEAFWDDWIRHNDQRRNRSCLRPELPRTQMSNYGKEGVSRGQFFDDFLSQMVLNERYVNWPDYDISQLIKKNYDRLFLRQVYTRSIRMRLEKYINSSDMQIKSSILIPYSNEEDFIRKAEYFGIMKDFKFGIPRTSYFGIVRIFFNNRTIYLAPNRTNKPTTFNQFIF